MIHTKHRHIKLDLAIPILIGATSYLLIVGYKRLIPSNIGWIGNTINPDTWTQYVGWELFRNSPWTFPVHRNLGYAGLESSNLYSGGIALFELPLKVFNVYLPGTFQYLGIWLLFCFCLQGISSWHLLGTVKGLSNFERSLGVVLFCFAPILTWRLNLHLGLAAQFLIIFAIYLCITENDKKSINITRWISLLVITLLVHGYFFVMCFTLLFFHLAGSLYSMRNHKTLLKGLQSLFLIALPSLFTAWVLGYMDSRSGWNSGFPNHLFKMDLTQPLNISGQSWLFSSVFPTTLGNPEGFNFFGIWVPLGVLIFVLLGAKRRHTMIEFWYANRYLGLALMVMTFFSLSNQISLGRRYIEVPFPSNVLDVFEIFRASGRFFWPTVYTIYVFIFFLYSKQMFYPRRILLLFLLMFHIGDNSYYWNQIDEISSKPLPQSITRLDGSFWPEIRRHYSSIMVQLNDKASQDIEPCTIWREIGYIATKYKFSTNCVSLARYNWEAIDSVNAKIVSNLESSEIEGLSLYLMTNSFQLMNRADMCSIKIEELYFFYESNNCLAIPSEDS